MKLLDIIVIVGLLFFAVIPDPLDILDFGTPILEVGAAIFYYFIRRRK